MKFNSKNLLLIIIVVSLVIRVGYVLTLEDKFFFPDSSRYDGIASELMLGKGFSSASTAPLYPVFLSRIHALFGHSFLAVRIVHSVIGTASIFIIYLIARDVFSEKVGLIAGLLGAIYPFFIFFTGLILTETLFIFLLLCLILFLRKMTFNMRWDYTIFHMKWGYAVCTGILAGLSILIKPVMAYFLLFAFIIILAICNDRRKLLLADGLLIFLIAGFVAAPWGWDNYKRSGKFIFLTTGGGFTLYESNNPQADGGPGGEKIVWTEEMKSMNEIELDRYFKQEAVLFIKNNPRRFAELAVIKFRRFWSFTPNAGGYQSWKYKLISIIFDGPIVLLAVWQIIAARRRWKELVFLYLPVVFFTLLHVVILGSLRYRMPIMPYVIIFAANGVFRLFHWKSRRKCENGTA
jgi:4-amino-4-deoxy-L-arabinose transferase-like glycosyltransferase